ncbi:hypothetical protein PMG11_11229 [Penicillium brasilianum]|uniref:Short-chain dehydrogenase/reductase n=1 Tax=Penicillium brasilianum TaxID=104259 RepID=A0A0F7U1J1_PENBI|nr:hypothetical protein PMG11_11229 [Penicillium brasilianum]
MGVTHSANVSFNPSTDIPSLKGKVILITGASSGLGKQSVLELSKHEPKEIWVASRQISKALEVIKELKELGHNYQIMKPIEIDLGSMNSVAKAARYFVQAQQMQTQSSPRLDILMLNAGIMAVPPSVTKDGFEIQFGTNYLGHTFLVHELLPLLVDTAHRQQQKEGRAPGSDDVRVILLSSVAHRYAPSGGINFGSLKGCAEEMGTVARYGQSKLAMILYGQELAKRYLEFKVAIVHPGQVKTNLGNTASANSLVMRLLWKLTSVFNGVGPETGVLNQLWAATVDSVQSGEYYDPVGVVSRQRSKYTSDGKLAVDLWNWTTHNLHMYEESFQVQEGPSMQLSRALD